MKIENYEAACLKFSADTKDRDYLDNNNFFQTIGGDWEETDDGSTAGISVKWAFKKTPDAIRAMAAQKFIDEILSEIDQNQGIYGNGQTAINALIWLSDIMR